MAISAIQLCACTRVSKWFDGTLRGFVKVMSVVIEILPCNFFILGFLLIYVTNKITCTLLLGTLPTYSIYIYIVSGT